MPFAKVRSSVSGKKYIVMDGLRRLIVVIGREAKAVNSQSSNNLSCFLLDHDENTAAEDPCIMLVMR